jgi:hypothetical protein
VLKISLALAAALIAGSAFVTTAEAGGCHHGFGGGFFHQSYASQSYASSEASLYAKRRAIARARAEAKAQAQAAAKARLLAASRAAAKINVAKVETPALKTADATTPVLKKADLETASTTPICRKFSAAVGGLVETACE